MGGRVELLLHPLLYTRRANGVMICFDITSQRSFERVANVWLHNMRDLCQQAIPCMLVGCKADLESLRAVTKADAAEFALACGMIGYMETSAKTSSRVKDCVDCIIKTVYHQQKGLLEEVVTARRVEGSVYLPERDRQERANKSSSSGCC